MQWKKQHCVVQCFVSVRGSRFLSFVTMHDPPPVFSYEKERKPPLWHDAARRQRSCSVAWFVRSTALTSTSWTSTLLLFGPSTPCPTHTTLWVAAPYSQLASSHIYPVILCFQLRAEQIISWHNAFAPLTPRDSTCPASGLSQARNHGGIRVQHPLYFLPSETP